MPLFFHSDLVSDFVGHVLYALIAEYGDVTDIYNW